ncbi:ubiquitin carboxyl-terminal hydrolase 10-like [Canna indica]|uniref:Ubiquitin carboxyl-terminal hydrolase 10-like n=1 Tax=Canna indica TaxID=4628 RepID=A0AAQ3KVT9_9LILI|nr:ubiquitin carboxyl-terminal hydrolase 10-like [Canna indica]
MVPELEKARVTELQVRMDCNGCVQRIKKAMHNVDGVYSMNIDVASQKLTVVGTAEPEQIVKAIKKARKIATICSHTEPGAETAASSSEQQPPPPEQAPTGDPPASDAANQPPVEPSKNDAPTQDNAALAVVKPSPEEKPEETKEVAEIHMVHHYPHGHYIHGGQWNYFPPRAHEIVEPPPHYSCYRTPSYAPQPIRYVASRAYDEDGYDHYQYQYRRGGGSAFSEENPNACSIF